MCPTGAWARRCRASDPNFVPAAIALGRFYVQDQLWSEARELLGGLLQRPMNSAERVEVFYLNGATREAQGDLRKAKDMFQRALGINSQHEPSRLGLQRLQNS